MPILVVDLDALWSTVEDITAFSLLQFFLISISIRSKCIQDVE